MPVFVIIMAVAGDQEFLEAFVFAVFGFVVAAVGELILYVQMKAQVKLFIASQVIEIQERQLLNMLDTVPDKVLVCSIERKNDLKVQPLYNNRQMKEFFGQSLVVQKQKQISPPNVLQIGLSRKPKGRKRQSAFNRRMFQQREDPLVQEKNAHENPENQNRGEESQLMSRGGRESSEPTF